MAKILVVEDDIYLLKLYQEIFTKEGFQVQTAEDGQEAIQKAPEFVPDVILLDLMLPYVDGFGVLENLKANPKTKDIPVVVSTNLDSQKQRDKAANLGAVKFLVKAGDNPGNIVQEVNAVISK